MYTFPFLALLGFLIAGIIFGKKIRQNQLSVIIIVFAVTLIGSSIVNGIIGLKYPLTLVEVKTKDLDTEKANIDISKDSTLVINNVYLDFEYDDEDDWYIDYNSDVMWGNNDIKKLSRLDIKLIELTGDSIMDAKNIPRVVIFKEKREVDSKWATNFGIPNGHKYWTLYLPDDSIHNLLLEHLNKVYDYDEKSIAQLN
jgi:hypothetical protein